MAVNRRLNKEYSSFQKEPLDWASVSLPDESNMLKWKATITGPDDSPYVGGVFTLDISIPPEYPFKPPEIVFVTKVYHPNISSDDGKFCADQIRARWSPQLTISKVLEIIRNMLNDPNTDSPLNAKAAEDFRTNKSKYEKTAKDWTKKHAK